MCIVFLFGYFYEEIKKHSVGLPSEWEHDSDKVCVPLFVLLPHIFEHLLCASAVSGPGYAGR